jgi:hypothetical protein
MFLHSCRSLYTGLTGCNEYAIYHRLGAWCTCVASGFMAGVVLLTEVKNASPSCWAASHSLTLATLKVWTGSAWARAVVVSILEVLPPSAPGALGGVTTALMIELGPCVMHLGHWCTIVASGRGSVSVLMLARKSCEHPEKVVRRTVAW